MAKINTYLAEKTKTYKVSYMSKAEITNEIYYWLKKYPDNKTMPVSAFMRVAELINEVEAIDGTK